MRRRLGQASGRERRRGGRVPPRRPFPAPGHRLVHTLSAATSVPAVSPTQAAPQLRAVIYRDAATGRRLARSRPLTAVLTGTMIQPGHAGRTYYLTGDARVLRLTARPG